MATNPPAQEDDWIFLPMDPLLTDHLLSVFDKPNHYVALLYRHGKPIYGRVWYTNGSPECSFAYKNAELTEVKELSSQIQVLQYKGDHNKLGFWYEWIKYKDRFEKCEHRQILKCADSMPIVWKHNVEGAILGYLDGNEMAHFSFNGRVETLQGEILNEMYIIVRNTKSGPPDCKCQRCRLSAKSLSPKSQESLSTSSKSSKTPRDESKYMLSNGSNTSSTFAQSSNSLAEDSTQQTEHPSSVSSTSPSPKNCPSEDSKGSSNIADTLFDLYQNPATETLSLCGLLKSLYDTGIRSDDPRLSKFLRTVRKEEGRQAFVDPTTHEPISEKLDRKTFKRTVGDAAGIITNALKKQLIIPDWTTFATVITEIFNSCRDINDGKLADYIPQLTRSDPQHWAVSICTIDGQRRSWGKKKVSFCVQSVSKPFAYAMVLDEHGSEEVHSYVGQEPSGRLFNEICLDYSHKPHNPMINAGAIVVTSLLQRSAPLADRFEFALQYFKRFAAGGFVGFNNAVFLSERETADRNYALSYYMREHKCFPPNTNLQETLDLYFQLCAIETNVDSLAVMAATLANGGVSPLSHERVVSNSAVRDTLSLMYSCGMYDYSGQFAFKVGLPAKSGVSGNMIIVIPNVMGISLYSPPLDSFGNSVRGVKFAEQLVKKFNFHNYDSLVYSDTFKIDPRKKIREVKHESLSDMMYAAVNGDVSAIQRYLLLGVNINERDYDQRTVLHIAASHGNENVLKFLLQRWPGSPDPVDRYGRTPLDDARKFRHSACVDILKNAKQKFANG